MLDVALLGQFMMVLDKIPSHLLTTVSPAQKVV